jgi:L-phenylalanine/L-methionine N-acetyltransferase
MIRPATHDDLSYIYELYMHPDINPYLLYEPMTLATFRPIFDTLIGQQQKYIFEESGQSIGMCKLVPFLHRTSHIVYLGGVAIHPDFAGRGFGKKMMVEILEFAQKRGFRRVELSTATTNTKAQQLYEKIGFEREGVYQKYTYLASQDRYLDEVVMSYWID